MGIGTGHAGHEDEPWRVNVHAVLTVRPLLPPLVPPVVPRDVLKFTELDPPHLRN